MNAENLALYYRPKFRRSHPRLRFLSLAVDLAARKFPIYLIAHHKQLVTHGRSPGHSTHQASVYQPLSPRHHHIVTIRSRRRRDDAFAASGGYLVELGCRISYLSWETSITRKLMSVI